MACGACTLTRVLRARSLRAMCATCNALWLPLQRKCGMNPRKAMRRAHALSRSAARLSANDGRLIAPLRDTGREPDYTLSAIRPITQRGGARVYGAPVLPDKVRLCPHEQWDRFVDDTRVRHLLRTSSRVKWVSLDTSSTDSSVNGTEHDAATADADAADEANAANAANAADADAGTATAASAAAGEMEAAPPSQEVDGLPAPMGWKAQELHAAHAWVRHFAARRQWVAWWWHRWRTGPPGVAPRSFPATTARLRPEWVRFQRAVPSPMLFWPPPPRRASATWRLRVATHVAATLYDCVQLAPPDAPGPAGEQDADPWAACTVPLDSPHQPFAWPKHIRSWRKGAPQPEMWEGLELRKDRTLRAARQLGLLDDAEGEGAARTDRPHIARAATDAAAPRTEAAAGPVRTHVSAAPRAPLDPNFQDTLAHLPEHTREQAKRRAQRVQKGHLLPQDWARRQPTTFALRYVCSGLGGVAHDKRMRRPPGAADEPSPRVPTGGLRHQGAELPPFPPYTVQPTSGGPAWRPDVPPSPRPPSSVRLPDGRK